MTNALKYYKITVFILFIANISMGGFYYFRIKQQSLYINSYNVNRNEIVKYIMESVDYHKRLLPLLSKDFNLFIENNVIKEHSSLTNDIKLILYFPKTTCLDCLIELFNKTDFSAFLEPEDFIIISNFLNDKESYLFQDILEIEDYALLSFQKDNILNFIKNPIFINPVKKTILVYNELFINDLTSLLIQLIN